MEEKYITLTANKTDCEQICCGFSEKKRQEDYTLKKGWLRKKFENGSFFRCLLKKTEIS